MTMTEPDHRERLALRAILLVALAPTSGNGLFPPVHAKQSYDGAEKGRPLERTIRAWAVDVLRGGAGDTNPTGAPR
jgi:hypothetical protein